MFPLGFGTNIKLMYHSAVSYGIHNIKDRLTLHILVASSTNKHVTFNKGQYIGKIEPSIDHMPQISINSLTT